MTATDITTDAFLGGALLLRQPTRGYRAGIDPVLLAASCPARAGDTVLDCGAGVGTVGLCLARRVAGTRVVMVEREAIYAALARDNIAANGLADRVSLVEADVTAPLADTPALKALVGAIDHALANPPYHVSSAGTRSTDPLKDTANAMPADDIEAWARMLAALVKPNGTATIVHRADALPLLLTALERRFGGLIVRPLYPRADTSANRVLVRGIKGSRAPLTLAAPLLVHDHAGYTETVSACLKSGAALPLLP